MVDNVSDKKQKKSFVSEANMSSVLQRYSPNTVLALLQEVAQLPVEKYDWRSLVKKTSTGITNAREYQMLWRHLAYSHGLLDKLEEGAEPLDDDSDLEHELQAFPDASSEASAEAAACVKVLIASGSTSDSSLPNNATVEAPLIINIPNGQSFRPSSDDSEAACSMQGINITVPVSVQKLPLPTLTSAEGLDGNGSIGGNMPPRKRRKQWTPEEDIELIAAVQKCGEGNWANILRGDFKWDRTASQLSQRWSVLRKKHGYPVPGISSSGTQLSEAQLAARHAMSLALDMPVKNIAASSANNSGIGTAAATSSTTTGISLPATASADSSPGGSSSAQAQPLQCSAGTKPAPLALPGPTAKSRAPPKKAPTKPNFSPDSSLRAAAVAAGARIMTPSDAASLLKGTQGKSAIHIMPSGGSSVKPSVSYIQTGVSSASLSSSSAVTSIAPPSSVKPSLQRGQQNSNVSSTEQTNAVLSSNPEVKAKEEMKVSGSRSVLGSESSKEVNTDNKGCPMVKPQVEVKKEAAFENRSSLDSEMGEGNQIGNDSTKIANANPIRNEGTKMTDANQSGKDDKMTDVNQSGKDDKISDANRSGNDDKKMTHANQTANDDKKMTGATQIANDDKKMTEANQTGNDDKMTDANQTGNDDKKMAVANQTVNDDKKMNDANQTGNDDTKMTDAEVEGGSKKQSATKAHCEPQSSNDKKVKMEGNDEMQP